VGVVAIQQQSTGVGLHPRVLFAAIRRNSGNAVVERLDLAPRYLHATMCEVALLLRGMRHVAITKSPMAIGLQEVGQRCDGCALCQLYGFVISDGALHKLPWCHLTRGYGRMEKHLVVDIVPVVHRLQILTCCRVVPANPGTTRSVSICP